MSLTLRDHGEKRAKNMKFTVDKAIFEKFPGVRLGVVVAMGVDNKKSEVILDFLRQEEKAAHEKLSGVVISQHEFIAPWREVYRSFGSKPNEYCSSVEALAKRVQKGKELPDINPLVNLYNALSLKYLLPFGGENLDKVKGDIYLTFATGRETGKYIGSDEKSTCYSREVAYVDDMGFICRRWNWREADRTKLTPETKNVVLVTEALSSISEQTLKIAVDKLSDLVKTHLDGKTKTFLLDKNHPSLILDFATGSGLGKISPDKFQSPKPSSKSLKSTKSKLTVRTNKLPVDDITSKLTAAVIDAIRQISRDQAKLGEADIHLEHPAVEAHGDYSSNVALAMFERLPAASYQLLAKNPRQFAETIVMELQKDQELKTIVSEITVAGPGFINFHLSGTSLMTELNKIEEEKDDFGKGILLKNKKIMIEFTDPNPFKEFHIGHLFSNTIGESLSRLFAFQGAVVQRVCYQGDVGMHVAKSVWGMKKLANDMPPDTATLQQKAKFMGRAYALGATKFEEDEQAKKEITDLNKKIYEHDTSTSDLYTKGRQWSLDYFETIYRRLGTMFDHYYFESQAGKVGLQFVKENLIKGIFKESDGAIVFPGEEFGLHTRVFVNSLGLPTYEAKDLGLAPTKFKDFPYDESVIVTGNEINEYFKVVLTALRQINPDLGNKTIHLSHGMVRLPEGKMSSRTGKILTGEWLLDETKRQLLEYMKAATLERTDEEREHIAEMVTIGSIKYALLKAGIGRDVIFDVQKSIAIEGNSGPYLQYTFARTQSVLAKADGASQMAGGQRPSAIRYQPNAEELGVLRWIYRFPEVVLSAAKNYAPNEVCTFLYELAQRFNTFYNKHRIVISDKSEEISEEKTTFRLLLTAAVGQVLKNGLQLLGIQAPARM